MPTLQDVIYGAKSRINEAVNTPAGALESGTNGTPQITTDATITAYVNEAKDELARTCLPLEGLGTATITAGQRLVPFSALTVSGGGLLWTAQRTGVSLGGVPLQQCSRGQADIYYPSQATDPNGVTAVWMSAGPQGILLGPKPSATFLAGGNTLSVLGLVKPPDLVNPGDAITFLEPNLTRLLECYAAVYICKKNWEDPSLQERAQLWMDEFHEGQAMLRRRLQVSDPGMTAQYYGGEAQSRGRGKE